MICPRARPTRRLLPCLSLCSALLLAGCATAGAETQRARWNQPSAPFRLIGNVYYVGTEGLASYLIATPEGAILLDGALAESAPQIERNLEALGFKLGDVKYLLNSHAHFDHSGGLAQLKRDTGAALVASEGDRSALEGGFYLGSEGDHSLDSVPVRVDRTIRDGETLTLGGTTLTANLTPGHTRGCTSWSMPVTEAGSTWQALFFCSATVAANRLVDPPQYPGIVDDYRETFERAKALKVDVFLASHPSFFDLQAKRARLGKAALNPFVDPSAFGAFLAAAEADFRAELARQQAKQQRAPR